MPTGLGDEKIWLCPSLDDSADDLSGNSNHGTYNGGMGTVADTSEGGSRAYDGTTGTSDYVSVTWPNSNLTTRSMSVWMQPVNFSRWVNDMPITGPIQLGSPINGIAFRNSLSGYPWNSTFEVAAPDTVHNGSWHHYAIVQDSTNTYVYSDGVLYASYTTHASTNYGSGNGVFSIAREASYIDDFRVYERKLSQTEITHLATSRGVEGNPYDFNGLGDEKLWLCPSLDDSADDISGNGNHGTYIAGASTVSDVSNGGTRAYSFNGTTQMLDVASPPSITGSSASISYWCKPNDTVSWRSPGGYVTSGFDDYRLTFRKLNTSNIRGYARYSTGGIQQTSSYSLSNFTYTDWNHYVVVAENGSVSLYVNGSLAVSGGSGSGNLGLGSTFTLGSQDLRSTGSWWNGYIDDCRVFDRALTTTEITALASKRGYEVPQGTGPFPHPLTISIKHPLG